MAAPKLSEAYIKNSSKLVLSFDQPLDDSVATPATCFSINYGRIPISSVEYYGTAQLIVNLDQAVVYKDKLQVNYQPPEDISLALRGALGNNPTPVLIRRNAVRAFYKVPVKNQLSPDENSWTANSNLGGGKQFIPDPNDPDFDGSISTIDICGDGSIIIGTPGGGSGSGNGLADGAITSLKDLVRGSGYTDGTFLEVPFEGGTGEGAKATVTITGGEFATVILSSPGSGYTVDDVLTVDDANVGAGGGVDFAITVGAINVVVAEQGVASGNGSVSSFNYPIAERPSPRAATPDDFILAYGLREAIQISNIDDADATQPNTDKIWMAIEDACALIDNYIQGATRAGRVLISSNRRRTSLIIARYYLDTVRRREDVKNDYERAITELDKARKLEDLLRPDLPWWQDPCNPNRARGIRSWRIPQVYNGVSGKGLSGFWTDPGHSEVDDWRYSRTNSEGNNDDGNWNRGGRRLAPDRTLDQPVDDGGNNDGGDTP